MSAGLRILNVNQEIIIDTMYNNFVLLSRYELTAASVANIAVLTQFIPEHSTYQATYDITSQVGNIESPIIALELSGSALEAPFCSYVQRKGTQVLLHIFRRGVNAAFLGVMYVYGTTTIPPAAGPGLRLYRTGTTEVAFDSRYSPMKPVMMVRGGQTASLPSASSHKYAVLCGITGAATLRISSYRALAFDITTRTYARGITISLGATNNVLNVTPAANDLETRDVGWIMFSSSTRTSNTAQPKLATYPATLDTVIIDVTSAG